MLGVGGFNNVKYNPEYLPSSIINIVQVGLIAYAVMLGAGLIRSEKKYLFGVVVLVAILLSVPAMILTP